jgi:hypothetical protein
VAVHENGRRRRISKIEAILKQLSNKTASGDTRSAKLLMDTSSKFKGLRSDALRGAPVGLREAIDSADWERVKKIAQFKSLMFEDLESNEEE